MIERPILFSDEMVRAILAGRKTVTRRVIKPEWLRCLDLEDPEDRAKAVAQSPYGAAGDRLWVKECFTTDHAKFYPHFPLIYRADGYDPREGKGNSRKPKAFSPESGSMHDFRWKPSIFMRREYSRILTEVQGVRIERIHDMTEEEALLEGLRPRRLGDVVATALQMFQTLWDKINKKRGFGWDQNDWVFRVQFARIDS